MTVSPNEYLVAPPAPSTRTSKQARNRRGVLTPISMPPIRSSLVDLAAARLRQGISEGRWKRELPSEAELCREMHISRVTLRRALAQLIREEWLTPGGRGSHHRIRKRPKQQKKTTGHIVRVLSPYPLSAVGSIPQTMFNIAAERLGSVGYRFEFEHRPSVFNRWLPEELERLTGLPDTAAWLLLCATEQMQRWFAGQSIPCMLSGRAVDGAPLSSIFADQQAVGRHAAGLFYQRGHRELAYFIAEFTSVDDRLCAEAFVQEAQRLGARAKIITHTGNASSVRAALNQLRCRDPRPTGFFSRSPEHCVTILCHLQSIGVHVPEHASIIAGWDDQFLQYTVPEITRYRVDGAKIGCKAATILLDLIRHGSGKLRTVPVVPVFVSGETLGPVALSQKWA